jgi:hypothetical protein
MKTIIDSQLELGFQNACPVLAASHPQKRLNRANWWFNRMRHIVDRAFDWKPAPTPRPEQIWLESVTR